MVVHINGKFNFFIFQILFYIFSFLLNLFYDFSILLLTFFFSPIRLLDKLNYLSVGRSLWKALHSCRFRYFCCCSTSVRESPLLSIVVFTPSNHLFLDLPTGLFPGGWHIKYFFGSLWSGILITWPYHLNWILSISSNNDSIFSSCLMDTFRILSLLVTPFTIRKTLISATCNLLLVFVVNDHASAPYRIQHPCFYKFC